MTEEERTAYHEAGHVIAALVFDWRIGSATIIPNGDTHGSMINVRPSHLYNPDPLDDFEAEILAAGPIGKYLAARSIPPSAQLDIINFDDLTSQAGATTDLNLAYRLIEEDRDWARGITTVEKIEYICRQAFNILQRKREDLDRLAAELLRKKTMRPREILTLIAPESRQLQSIIKRNQSAREQRAAKKGAAK